MRKASEMSTMCLQHIGATVREFIADDLDAVMQVECAAFKRPLTERRMIRTLCRIGTESLVLQRGSAVLGYLTYEVREQYLFINRIAVSCPLCGFGKMLVSDVQRRCITSGSKWVDVLVDERDLNSQKFFSRVRFKAIDIVKGNSDQYLFRHLRGDR